MNQMPLFEESEPILRHRLEKRLPEIERLIAKNPDNPDNYVMYASGLLLLGRPEKAEKYARKAINMRKDFVNYVILGDTLFAQHKFEEARSVYKKALDIATETDKHHNIDFFIKAMINIWLIDNEFEEKQEVLEEKKEV